jgi:hypothetical protein
VGGFVLRYFPYLVLIALWIYAFVDCLGTPESEVRGLPKVIWLLIVLLFGEIMVGPLAWLLIGRRRGPREIPVEPPAAWAIAPDDNPEFLRSLSELNKRNRNGGQPSEGE